MIFWLKEIVLVVEMRFAEVGSKVGTRTKDKASNSRAHVAQLVCCCAMRHDVWQCNCSTSMLPITHLRFYKLDFVSCLLCLFHMLYVHHVKLAVFASLDAGQLTVFPDHTLFASYTPLIWNHKSEAI